MFVTANSKNKNVTTWLFAGWIFVLSRYRLLPTYVYFTVSHRYRITVILRILVQSRMRFPLTLFRILSRNRIQHRRCSFTNNLSEKCDLSVCRRPEELAVNNLWLVSMPAQWSTQWLRWHPAVKNSRLSKITYEL